KGAGGYCQMACHTQVGAAVYVSPIATPAGTYTVPGLDFRTAVPATVTRETVPPLRYTATSQPVELVTVLPDATTGGVGAAGVVARPFGYGGMVLDVCHAPLVTAWTSMCSPPAAPMPAASWTSSVPAQFQIPPTARITAGVFPLIAVVNSAYCGLPSPPVVTS